jgi:hypothetical protein
MKNLILVVILLIGVISCTPVRYVNVERKHNYYQRHRANTYTVPVWVPGRGMLLETRIYRLPKANRRLTPNRLPRGKK